MKCAGGYEAFIPNPLPPEVEITPRLARAMSEADHSVGQLAGEGRSLPNPHLLMRAFVTQEAVLSSRIEGTQATLGELLAANAGALVERSPDDLREVGKRLRNLHRNILGRMRVTSRQGRRADTSANHLLSPLLETLEPRVLLSAWQMPSEVPVEVPGIGIQVSDDSFLPPLEYLEELATSPVSLSVGQRPFGATASDLSEYMIGTVQVNVVLMESNGSIDTETEDWTSAEIDNVKSEILEGLRWWKEVSRRRGSTSLLSFNIDFTHADTPYQTSYEPITRSAGSQFL